MLRFIRFHLWGLASQGFLLGAFPAIASTDAYAQADVWPSKPLRIIVPANAGGGTADPLSRVFADELTKVLGQRVYVENRALADLSRHSHDEGARPTDRVADLVCPALPKRCARRSD
jgi:hypothetical protein